MQISCTTRDIKIAFERGIRLDWRRKGCIVKKKLAKDDYIGMIDWKSDRVHTFVGGRTVLMGADMDRSEIIPMIENAMRLETIGSKSDQAPAIVIAAEGIWAAMHHKLGIYCETYNSYVWISTKKA